MTTSLHIMWRATATATNKPGYFCPSLLQLSSPQLSYIHLPTQSPSPPVSIPARRDLSTSQHRSHSTVTSRQTVPAVAPNLRTLPAVSTIASLILSPFAPSSSAQVTGLSTQTYSSITHNRLFSTTATTMDASTPAEEDMYTKFLSNANQPRGSPPSEIKAYTTSSFVTSSAPPHILNVVRDRFYTSDIDSPFEPVSIPLPKGLGGSVGGKVLSLEEFATALGVVEDAVSRLELHRWNPKGEYRDVVEAVKEWVGVGKVGEGEGEKREVGVFAVEGEGRRIEYFVVGVVAEPERRAVGVKVFAVES